MAILSGIVLGVGGDIAPTDFLDGDVLDVKAHIITGKSFGERFVVHLHRFDLKEQVKGKTRSRIHMKMEQKKLK